MKERKLSKRARSHDHMATWYIAFDTDALPKCFMLANTRAYDSFL